MSDAFQEENFDIFISAIEKDESLRAMKIPTIEEMSNENR